MNDINLNALIFLVLGIGLLVTYIYLRQKRNRLLSTGTVVEGIVFDLAAGNAGDSSTGGYPVIRFVTTNQEWITETYKISYPDFILKAGQKVQVYYNPDKPSDFILNLSIDKWVLGLLLILSLAGFAGAIISVIN